MKASLVQQYLKELGRSAVGQQLDHMIAQPTAEQPTCLSADQIEKLNRTETRLWCKHLGLKVRGTVPELKARLKEHFKGSGN